jgi:uncharacterized membrane protein HdeD (DUF308 family)
MTKSDQSAVIAAAVILIVFGLVAFLLPTIMVDLAAYSTYAAAAFGAVFLVAPFVVLWLRGRSQRNKEK